jgi:outer membrane protein W
MPGHIQILFIGSAQESDARFFTRKPGDLVSIPDLNFSNSSALFEPVGIGFMPESNKILEMAVSRPMLKTMAQLRKYSK